MTALVYFVLCSIVVGVHGRTPPMTKIEQDYDCVDFYKQPAFSHPLIKDHIPTVRLNSSKSVRGNFNFKGLGEGGCPSGTVPISKTSFQTQSTNPTNEQVVHCYATVRTKLNNKKFYGSNGSPTIYKPKAQGNQWSSTRVKLMNGPDSIEAGLMVYPDFFKDDEVHLYAKFTTESGGCINYQCPGFVQVDQGVHLGVVPQAHSTIGGPFYFLNISIVKHPDDGNWWMLLTIAGGQGTNEIGYWPQSLFKGLSSFATQVEWGGEVNNPGAVSPPPEMGSGSKAEIDMSKSAFFYRVSVVDEKNQTVSLPDTEIFQDCPKLYTALDYRPLKPPFELSAFYGGA